jgi:hypothetical protein
MLAPIMNQVLLFGGFVFEKKHMIFQGLEITPK